MIGLDTMDCLTRVTRTSGFNHSEKIYVLGDIHTQTIDEFWGLVKRGIGGVYHAVSKKYLQSYLNEYSFRYNRRDAETSMFTLMISQVSERASELSAAKARGILRE